MYLINIITIILLISCSFKSDEKNNSKSKNGIIALDLNKIDSDGDFLSDQEEINLGLDRHIANIPKLKVSFLQDYKIKATFKENDIDSFVIDSKVFRNNPDYQFRVGSLFLRENSIKQASKLGRFSGVSWGRINQKDYTWVKYPELSTEFYHSKFQEYESSYIQNNIKSLEITLENVVKLEANDIYSEIKDLELNFYYYDYRSEEYRLLTTHKSNKTFLSGTTENIVVEISNAPIDLLEENYLRRGEFIISEVKDYFIPELGIKYSQLMNSVKSKSIPVYEVTPFENTLQYVGLNGKSGSFVSILKKLYDNNFAIQDNKLVSLKQFSASLPNFTNLTELREVDKVGNWFVMTNKLKKHYLDHEYSSNDSITLSYITGTELSKSIDENVFSAKKRLRTKKKSNKVALGNITNNSDIELTIYPVRKEGISLDIEQGQFSYRPPRCRNCTGNNWSVSVPFEVRRFRNYQSELTLSENSPELTGIDILINGTTINLDDLIKDGFARIESGTDSNGNYLNIKIHAIHRLNLINIGQENIAYLKVNARNIQELESGVHIKSVQANNTNPFEHAMIVAGVEANKRGVPIAVSSWGFEVWSRIIPWEKIRSGKGFKRKSYDGFSIDYVANIKNYIN